LRDTTIKIAFSMLLISSIFIIGCGSNTSSDPDADVVKDKSIVGAWDFNDGTEYGMLIFYANGSYIHWQDGQIDPNCGAPVGVEYGTYSLLVSDLSHTTIIDDSGQCGVNDIRFPDVVINNVIVSGDTLSFDGYPLNRVIPPNL